MTREVIFHPQVEMDTQEAYHWYEARSDGLGSEFLVCVGEAIEEIRYFPGMYAVVQVEPDGRQIRRARVRRFPHGVFYVLENETISVVAVIHPGRGLDRLRDRI